MATTAKPAGSIYNLLDTGQVSGGSVSKAYAG